MSSKAHRDWLRTAAKLSGTLERIETLTKKQTQDGHELQEAVSYRDQLLHELDQTSRPPSRSSFGGYWEVIDRARLLGRNPP